MMSYRPENTNIGILWSISHHIQCLNSQQLFYYITLKKQRKKQALSFSITLMMRKPILSMYEKEDADQLRGYCATVRSTPLFLLQSRSERFDNMQRSA